MPLQAWLSDKQHVARITYKWHLSLYVKPVPINPQMPGTWSTTNTCTLYWIRTCGFTRASILPTNITYWFADIQAMIQRGNYIRSKFLKLIIANRCGHVMTAKNLKRNWRMYEDKPLYWTVLHILERETIKSKNSWSRGRLSSHCVPHGRK